MLTQRLPEGKANMPLHPQVKKHLARLDAMNFAGLHTVPPEQAREGLRRLTAASAAVAEPVEEVLDETARTPAGDIRIRLYRPEATPASHPLPVVVFFHGGGFVLGDLDTHDGLARAIANASQAAVVSVDYPLAPENKYPAQVDAAFVATEWVVHNASRLHVDGTRLALAGDSAGGNLAAVVALRSRDEGGPSIRMQALIYPDLDFRRQGRSIVDFAGKYGNISRDAQVWFMDHYLKDASERLDPRVSPVLEPDLSGLPAAFILTAEYDALRDEGEEYGRALQEAGVAVEVKRYDGMIHEFLRQPFDDARTAIAELGHALRTALLPIH